MANKEYYTLSEEALDKLCGLIRESHSVAEGIDDNNVATNSTFSSKKIKEMINKGGGYDDTAIKSDISANSEAIETLETDISSVSERVMELENVGGGSFDVYNPHHIGEYVIPWFIEGQGQIIAFLTQLQKNVFSLDITGGGSPFTMDTYYKTVDVSLPIQLKQVDGANSNVSTGTRHFNGLFVVQTTSDGGLSTGSVTFTDHPNQKITFYLPKATTFAGIISSKIIIYGELIEDETA